MPHLLHLVRHGQSTWNVERRVQGQVADVPLTDLGLHQARTVAYELSRRTIDAVICSDQLRATGTAEVIATRLGLDPEPDPRWREQSLGELEGLTLTDALLVAGDLDWVDPDVRPGGGESLREVHARVRAAVADLPSGEIVVVSHGDTIRVALAVLAGRPAEQVPHAVPANGSITTIERR